MKHLTATLTSALIGVLVTHAAHAANDLDYLQEIKVPKELPSAQAFQGSKSTYYLKIPNFFGSELVSAADNRLSFKTTGETAVFVQFKSAVVAATLQEQMRSRGFKIAESREKADLVLGGEIVYQDQHFPNPPRRIAFTEKLDPPKGSFGGGNKTVSMAAFELAPVYLANGVSASAFGASLMLNLFEVTGASKLFAAPADQKNSENFLLLDCYDKVSRKSSSCISDDQLLLSYRGKVRVQAIDIKAFMGKPGSSSSDFKRVRVVSRSLDSRGGTESRLVELLADAMNELVSGLGDEPQQAPQLGTNAAPSESLPTEDVSATGQKQ
ncbi:hypothetical protein [Limnohabitans sp.]|jgi:hypothetical protein|uniref:hypothetical protein n=1 Tax=Limnohabitans sp. TaxID=1907725 RepID=UPI0037BFAFF5